MSEFSKGWRDFYYFLKMKGEYEWAEHFYKQKKSIEQKLQQAYSTANILYQKTNNQRGLDTWM